MGSSASCTKKAPAVDPAESVPPPGPIRAVQLSTGAMFIHGGPYLKGATGGAAKFTHTEAASEPDNESKIDDALDQGGVVFIPELRSFAIPAVASDTSSSHSGESGQPGKLKPVIVDIYCYAVFIFILQQIDAVVPPLRSVHVVQANFPSRDVYIVGDIVMNQS